jgi:hypothetical protein
MGQLESGLRQQLIDPRNHRPLSDSGTFVVAGVEIAHLDIPASGAPLRTGSVLRNSRYEPGPS